MHFNPDVSIAAATIIAVLLLGWGLAVPICLYERLSGRAAPERSRELLCGHKKRAAMLVLGWIGGATLVSLVVLFVLGQGIGLLLSLLEGVGTLIAVTALAIGLLTIASAALSFLAYAGYSFIVIHPIDLVRGNLRLNIEIKFNGHDVRLAERTAALVRENGFVEESLVTSLDSAGLQRVREVAPNIKIGQIVTAFIGDFVKLDVDFLSINAGFATPAQVRTNRNAGLDTHVWTVNDKASMARMIERGVNNIITDEPELLRRVIDERAELSDGELLLLALSARLRE